jgi:UDP-N-acetylmuramate dehydrogenase
MNWYSGLEAILKRDEPLAGYTTFRIGGKAAFVLTPLDAETFAAAYRAARQASLEVYILGMGSNLLIADEGVSGVVLSTRGLCRRELSPEGDGVIVGAGVRLRRLVAWTAQVGLSGLEFMAGIPGTVGGAVVMNAGGLDGCIGNCVRAVWYATKSGLLRRREGDDIVWDYRSTDIAEPVVQVELELVREDAETVLERMAEALVAKRRVQPVGVPSAGCFFKNPSGDSAGRLIDAADLKGVSVGGALVSARHANFIINRGGAKASHVFELCKMVRERVRTRFGVELDNEVHVWPGVREIA